jgi:hypothetical protein
MAMRFLITVVIVAMLGWPWAVLTFNHAGQYVRVIEERIARDAAFPMFGVSSPLALEPREPGPTNAATIAGPIAPGNGPPESTCGLSPPHVKLAEQVIRRGNRLDIGRVLCLVRCRVRVGLTTCLP